MKVSVAAVKETVVLVADTKVGTYYYVTKDAIPQIVIDYMCEEVTPNEFINVYNSAYRQDASELRMTGVAVDSDLFVFSDGTSMTPEELDRYLFPKMYEEAEIKQFIKTSEEVVNKGVNAIKEKNRKHRSRRK